MFVRTSTHQRFNAEMLERAIADSADIQEKLWLVPIPELTCEERLKLRHILMEVSVATKFVRQEADRALAEDKKTFIQRLFKK